MNKRIISLLIISILTLQGCGGSGGGGGGGGAPAAAPVQMGGSIQGISLSLTGNVNTIAGVAVSTDGVGPAANFNYSMHITSDGTSLFVADSSNHTIRQIDIATGTVSTLAGLAGHQGSVDGTGSNARFRYPQGVTTDGTNLYVTDIYSRTIRKIVIATGVVTTIAGTAGMAGTADGTGAAARFDTPRGITTDGTNLYISDTTSHTIRKLVLATNAVTTLAGMAGVPGSADNTGTMASFNYPFGITTDGTNLYVADYYNNSIRRIVIATGVVDTLAGMAGMFGSADGTGAAARFALPAGVHTDGTNLYVSDSGNNTIRSIVISTGVVTTLAGTPGPLGGNSDGIGAAAKFRGPHGIVGVGANLYIVDNGNFTIRKLALASADVSTFAGIAAGTDGVASDARFVNPQSVTTDGNYLYMVDNQLSVIRRVDILTNEVVTIAGKIFTAGTTDGNGVNARIGYPEGITTDGSNLYFCDSQNHTIRKMDLASGDVTTIAGTAGMSGTTDGTGTAARFNYPTGLTTDGTNLYISDTINHTIRKLVLATGDVTTLAGTASVSGDADGIGAAALFFEPKGITTDGTSLFIADYRNFLVRRIDIASANVTTLAGGAGMPGEIDAVGTSARFNYPADITSDGTNLYVVDDYSGYTVRRIVISTGEVTTIAGLAYTLGSTDGTGSAARFYRPTGITTDGNRLFVTDRQNATIRSIQ